MATIAPQNAQFKALIEDVFGATSTAPLDAGPVQADATPLTDRQIYRETVASVAARAKHVMDAAVHGRIDKAEALVLAGDVELLADGTACVGSQTSGSTQYLVNGVCACALLCSMISSN